MKWAILLLALTGCLKKPPPEDLWVMSWSCGTNQQCKTDMAGASWHYAFDTEKECADWEAEFLATYPGGSVTPCNYLN